ncbi:Peptidase A22A, presenilin [Dillenia turbinata]|uniref:Presenilin n=1 Tax=Dillenia turbinata TaxID=194707 RepID=A0AAN8V1N7_9MAGN
MAQNSRPTSLLDSLGEEIIRIVTPVSICMFLVVVLVSVLNEDSSNSASVSSIATIAYNESSSDSDWDKFIGALWNSLAFVGIVIVATFILVLLFYFRCTKLLKIYLGFSAFVVLGFLGGEVALFLITDYSFPIDCITFVVILLNFSVVGVIAVFMSKMAIFVTQGYLVVIGMLVAYWFTLLPEWTTWVLLVAMALYDLAAVLLPIGPLRILVELAISRDEEIPALVYEARPVTQNNSSNATGVARRRVWRETSAVNSDSIEDQNSGALDSDSVGNNQNGENLVSAEEGRHQERISELTAPLIEQRLNYHRQMQEEDSSGGGFPIERIGLGSSGAIKLGLGDFIFYSVLVGRAAMYDFMAVYACYLAIVAGLGVTLILLVLYQKALPALPVSIFLENAFYVLGRKFRSNLDFGIKTPNRKLLQEVEFFKPDMDGGIP